jgi:hypothetical protein
MEVLKGRASRQRDNMTTAEEQVATPALFDDFVRLYQDQPERIKGLIPKFVPQPQVVGLADVRQLRIRTVEDIDEEHVGRMSWGG